MHFGLRPFDSSQVGEPVRTRILKVNFLDKVKVCNVWGAARGVRPLSSSVIQICQKGQRQNRYGELAVCVSRS